MLINRETDYALRILRALSSGTRCSIETICSQEAAPKQFAYRIIKKLEKIHWITITRGVDGGCQLSANLETVNLFQLMEGMGSGLAVNACLQPGYECSRRAVCNEPCHIQLSLMEIQRVLEDELKSHSIYALISGSP